MMFCVMLLLMTQARYLTDLSDKELRGKLGRDPQHGVGVIVSQSVKTTGAGGAQRGLDGGKKIRG